MADICDSAGDLIEQTEERNISAIRAAAADIPVGVAGVCESCDTYSKRLVNDMCAPCRDKTY